LAIKRVLNRIERAYRHFPAVRVRWIALVAVLAVAADVGLSIASRPKEERVEVSVFNSLTSFMRGWTGELVNPDYYEAQGQAFLRQFYQSTSGLPRYDLYIDPTELNRLEAPLDDRRTAQELWDYAHPTADWYDWKHWYPPGERKTAVAVLKSGEDLFPVHIRPRGEGSNHLRGPFKSWRLARIALPGRTDWPFPADVLNLSLPEFHLMEWIAYQIAERAGIDIPRTEPVLLYVNGVYHGVRLLRAQSGPALMRQQGQPIGFVIDPRNDRWDTMGIPDAPVRFDYRFGNQDLGGDFRTLRLDFRPDDIVDLYTFFLLYRSGHIVDTRIYLDPLGRRTQFIPWNLETPARSRTVAAPLPTERRLLDFSRFYFEEGGGVEYLFGELLYPKLTPRLLRDIFAKIHRVTRPGAPLDLERVKQDYRAMEERLRADIDAMPYWYGTRGFNFHFDVRELARELRDDWLFPVIEKSFTQAIAAAETAHLACSYATNADEGSALLGRLSCHSASPVGAELTALQFPDGTPAILRLVWDRNRNGRIDADDRRLPGAATADHFTIARDGFPLLNDGEQLHPFEVTGELNSYDFLMVGEGNADLQLKVAYRQPLTGHQDTISVTREADTALRQAAQAAALPDWQSDATPVATDASGADAPSDLPAFVSEYGEAAYRIGPGEHLLESPLVLPEGASLTVAAGAEVTLAEASYLYLTGPLYVEGAADDPVKFLSRGKPGTGGSIIVNYTRGPESRLAHFSWQGGGDLEITGIPYSGAITFLGASAVLRSCSFSRTLGARALDFRWARGDIADCIFEDLSGGAVGFDSSVGHVADSGFAALTDDAIRISQSNVRLDSVTVKGAGGKAIAIGGRSYTSIQGSHLMDSEVGLLVKDDSHADLTGSLIAGNRLGLHLNREELWRNSMTVSLRDTRFEENGLRLLKDPGTPERGLIVDGAPF